MGRYGNEPPGEELGIVHQREADHVEAGRERHGERGEQHGPHDAVAGAQRAARPASAVASDRRDDHGAHAASPSRDSRSMKVCTRAIDSTTATRITPIAEATPMWFSSKASR